MWQDGLEVHTLAPECTIFIAAANMDLPQRAIFKFHLMRFRCIYELKEPVNAAINSMLCISDV